MDEELQREVESVRKTLLNRLESVKDKRSLLRSSEIKALANRIPDLPVDQRALFGKALNQLKQELTKAAEESEDVAGSLDNIDVSAPFAVNAPLLKSQPLLSSDFGSEHPLMSELSAILEIFYGMGFSIVESREIDDDWHMFGSLNFPEGHPARDDYDTFMTRQTDDDGKPWIAPAHTSTMQNRVLSEFKGNLEKGEPIAVVIPGRVFRNEDVDPRHEHTFYQLEGIFVDKGVSIGSLIATLNTYLEAYYQKEIKVKTQPFYFPFTEPSLEFAMSCPFCDQSGCRICSNSGWIELIGCGMVHPKVLIAAGIDPAIYQGFAWGGGIERLVMMKYGIEDIRLFESGNLEFLRQFSAGGNNR